MLPDELSVSQLAGDPVADRLELADLYGPAGGGLPDELSAAWQDPCPPEPADYPDADFDPVSYLAWLTRQVPEMDTAELCELVSAGPVSRELEPGEGDAAADMVAAAVAELGRRLDRMSRTQRVEFHAMRVSRRVPMPLLLRLADPAPRNPAAERHIVPA